MKKICFLTTGILFLSFCACAEDFASQWDRSFDRVWIGEQYWANPMEDWRVAGGRLECTSNGGNRNVHVLTHGFGKTEGEFEISVRMGLLERGGQGSAGFRIGIHDDINDYKGNCLWGKGIDAGVTVGNKIRLGDKEASVKNLPLKNMKLILTGKPSEKSYKLNLRVIDTGSGKEAGLIEAEISAAELIGNLALVNNFAVNVKKGSRFWFADWKISGSKIERHEDRFFGPILWAMHTVSNSHGKDGYVMKMSALLPPLGQQDSRTVRLEVKEKKGWKSLGEQEADPDAWTAAFRIPEWQSNKDVPYRLLYTMKYKDGKTRQFERTGTIRKEPVNRPLIIAGMTCQYHYAFPYSPLAKNLAAINPDVLYFSGDQIYEPNGHFGLIRTPADRSILNYLRKYYLFGWAFGDLMRDRLTLCTPDDHDVFQGNLWGNGGNPIDMKDHQAGGYAQPAKMVNVVHRTHTAHHPDFYDPAPIQQGISVFYGDMVYGRVSFAIVADRMFKSGPLDTVTEWKGRPDHITDRFYEMSRVDKPGLVLLGERQEKFLSDWVEDWRCADMKIMLSQTVFANVATHHGNREDFLAADLDSGGWPQTPRNRAIEIMRKGFALHLNGDQHFTTLLHYGTESQRDGNWSLCTPAIAVGYQRWWLPDEINRPFENRPAHGLANTGEYLDGFENKIYVYAVGNPSGSDHPNRYKQAEIRASGFSVVRIDKQDRTYTCESYRFLADLSDGAQKEDFFRGFPHTIKQFENYGREPAGYLDVYKLGSKNQVVKIIDEKSGGLVYAFRSQEEQFQPWVFEQGSYTVKIGEPEQDQWKTYTNQKIQKKSN